MYKISYVADGNTTEFSFVFPFFQEADVRVAIDNVVLDNVEYDVNPNEGFDGGLVVFANPPAADSKIDIFRRISLSRVVDYQPTAKIDPEDLNTDFNFLLEAFRDIQSIDLDLAEWKNVHDNVLTLVEYTKNLIEDKLSGGAVLGLYKNLVSVLADAMPELINDYGYVTEPAQNENRDDYGVL